MDDAAANGHAEEVKWLHENRSERCTVEAMECAAYNGHSEVVPTQHASRTEGCALNGFDDGEAFIKLMEIAQWLHEMYRAR
ncbi:hypothetical protein Gpo141_00008137 [Globisporangium polare]